MLLACLITVTLLVAACSSTPEDGGSATVFPQEDVPTGTIAFTAYRGGAGEIYVMNADGSNQVALTSDPGNDTQPAWSPDGTRLAYASGPGDWNGGRLNIWVMNSDGSGKTRLTSGDHSDVFPAWSPDGTSIVFSRRDGNGPFHLFSMLADGTDLHQLTVGNADDMAPTWTFSGRIVFVRNRTATGYGDVYVVDADGDEPPAPLTRGQRVGGYALSPDETQLLIYDGDRETVVIRSIYAGREPIAISSEFSPARLRLAWSPNGEWIAIGGDFFGPAFDIQLISADGSRRIEVPGVNDTSDPAWKPEAPT